MSFKIQWAQYKCANHTFKLTFCKELRQWQRKTAGATACIRTGGPRRSSRVTHEALYRTLAALVNAKIIQRDQGVLSNLRG